VAVELGSVPEASTQLRASIVVPVYNRINITRALLNALREQELRDTEVIVVDDGSSPIDAAELDAYANEVRVIHLRTPGGYGPACNAGAKLAGGRYLVLLNNDTLPLDGWLDAMSGYADEHPAAGIVGARLLWPDMTVQHAGVVFGAGGGPYHLYTGMPAEHPAARRSRRLRAVTAAAMLVRREAWEALGGFDSRFINGFEDVDLCLRAGELGYEVHVCGEATLLHLESATRGARPRAELENTARLFERWGRLEADDIATYAADGLISSSYTPDGLTVLVDPALGQPQGDSSPVQDLLIRRARDVYGLRKQTLALRAAAADPWADPVAHRAIAPENRASATVIVAVSNHGNLPDLMDALEAQTIGADEFDVIAVNTGNVLDAQAADALARKRRLRIRAFDAIGSRAAAWNRGIAEATSDIVILLADDFVPGPHLVERHLRLHREDASPEVVGIGPTRFPEPIRRDRFARWIEDSGQLFGVSFTRSTGELPPGWFYCANASAKRSFLMAAGGFDERFPHHAQDDAEFGTRLRARGMRSVYLPGALAIHDHPLTLRERQGQVREAGESLAIHDSIYQPPHPWRSGVETRPLPSRSAVAWTWLRHVLARSDQDHAAYYERVLERTLVRAYRRAVRRQSQA
jgi:GT2 family glycosyltransferase